MPSKVRQPRARILIEGSPVSLAEMTVNTSRHARSDTFSGATALQATGQSLGYWSSVGPVECLVQGCNDIDDGWVTLLKGKLDAVQVRADPGQGVKIHFSGRDNSAKLIDSKLTKKNLNKKSSDIVADLAQQHGLKADVDDTGDDAGKVHTQDNTQLIDNETAWNVIARLAEREGAFLYFKDDTVFFKQAGSDQSGGTYPIQFTPPSEDEPASGNVIAIQLTQNVHLNKGVKQTVRSFHTRKEKNVCTTEDPQGTGGSEPLEFEERIPGLTDDQVAKIAKKKQIQRQRHEMQIEAQLPGDVNFDPRMMVELSGTESAWDQQYHCNTCTHQFETSGGYYMRITAQNKKGGEGGGGENTGAGGGTTADQGDASAPVQGPPAPIQNAPLPPTRPAGL